MKKLTSLCLALALLLCLLPTAFAAKKPAAGDMGGVVYEALYVDIMGKSYDYSVLGGGKLLIELCEDGTGQSETDEGCSPLAWSGEDGIIQIEGIGSDRVCRLENDVLSISSADMTLQLVNRNAPAVIKKTMESRRQLNGDFFGWWMLGGGSGKFAGMAGRWWDMCARVYFGTDGFGTVSFWDEESSAEQPLGELRFSLFDDGFEYLIPVSEEGYFRGGAVAYGDWLLDASEEKLENMLLLSKGVFTDTDGDSAECSFMLRPWFFDWEDVRSGLGEEYLPYNYDWYLRLINAGLWMPGAIGEKGLTDVQRLESLR